MAIYRGDGTPDGGENVYSQADLDTAVAAALASETAAAASETAAEAAQTAAELAETNAETAETNAETAETNAETAETGAVAAQAAASAALDSFDDRYLGAKASDPALDNDGDALLTGALYYKTTATVGMYVYSGSVWTLVTGMSNVVEDLTPQLGGDLDVNGSDIVSISNGDINIVPNGTGEAQVDGQQILTESLAGKRGEIIAEGSTTVVGDATTATPFTFDMSGLALRNLLVSVSINGVSGFPTAVNNDAGIAKTEHMIVSIFTPSAVYVKNPSVYSLALLGSGYATLGVISVTQTGTSNKDWNIVCTNGTGAHVDADSTLNYTWVITLLSDDQTGGV